MADTLTLKANPLSVPTIQDVEVSLSLIRGTRTAPSNFPRKLRTRDASAHRILRSTSKPMHQGLSLSSGDHPLGTVQNAPLFRDLSVSEFRQIAGAGQERIYSRNETIFAEGDPLRCVSIVTAGHAKTVRNSAVGKVMILYFSGPGDVLDGLGSPFASTHFVEAQSVQHCQLFTWDVGLFESLSNRFPVLRRNSSRLLLERLRMLEGRVHELATERVPQRLAKLLLRLIVQARGSVRPETIELTGEELALMVGTTQFTVSRLLCDWAEQRIIQAKRSAIHVENLPGLIAVAMQVGSAE
jgi:CRP/FNR family transcriptional regulator, nitrogen oxide reductase regulator